MVDIYHPHFTEIEHGHVSQRVHSSFSHPEPKVMEHLKRSTGGQLAGQELEEMSMVNMT
jgi:hypothetical protein